MKYIDIDGIIHQVEKIKKDSLDTLDPSDMLEGNAYRIGKVVLPYRGKYKDKFKKVPGIYRRDGKLKFIFPLGKLSEVYHKKHVYENDINNILDLIYNKSIKAANDLLILMSDSEEAFKPIITSDDNFLQVLVKEMIIHKNVSLDMYKSRFNNPGDVNNHKKGLLHHGKMSIEKGLKWANVMDLEMRVELRDKKGCANPSGIIAEYDTTTGIYLYETDEDGNKTKAHRLDFNNQVEITKENDLEDVD